MACRTTSASSRLGSPLLLLSLLALSPSAARAVVPYPDYASYQAERYEQHAGECIQRLELDASCARLLETAIVFDDKRASSHHALGTFYLRTGELARAQAAFANAIRLNPDLHDAVRGLAQIYSLQGQLQLAEEKFLQYRKLEPEDPLGALGMATVAVQRGDQKSAAGLLKEAIARGLDDRSVIEEDKRWAGVKDQPAIQALLAPLASSKTPTPRP